MRLPSLLLAFLGSISHSWTNLHSVPGLLHGPPEPSARLLLLLCKPPPKSSSRVVCPRYKSQKTAQQMHVLTKATTQQGNATAYIVPESSLLCITQNWKL
eukprot:5300700-Amphidinium_carterae.1